MAAGLSWLVDSLALVSAPRLRMRCRPPQVRPNSRTDVPEASHPDLCSIHPLQRSCQQHQLRGEAICACLFRAPGGWLQHGGGKVSVGSRDLWEQTKSKHGEKDHSPDSYNAEKQTSHARHVPTNGYCRLLPTNRCTGRNGAFNL